jgi:hypothetical protein
MKKLVERLEEAVDIISDFWLEKDSDYLFKESLALINGVIEELKTPRWETPEEYLTRTGEEWPDDGAVYFCAFVKTPSSFTVYTYEDALRVLDMTRAHTGFDVKYQIVCATEAGPPPNDWRPKCAK